MALSSKDGSGTYIPPFKLSPLGSSCGVIIDPSEQYVLYDDKAYHKGCFRCSQCQTPLNGKQFCIVNGQYLCPEHVQ
ncbi:hypothetical protein ACTXT7_012371 [Hymenolepis weldensis]